MLGLYRAGRRAILAQGCLRHNPCPRRVLGDYRIWDFPPTSLNPQDGSKSHAARRMPGWIRGKLCTMGQRTMRHPQGPTGTMDGHSEAGIRGMAHTRTPSKQVEGCCRPKCQRINRTNVQRNYCKVVIKPTSEELEAHKIFLKKELKKNYYWIVFFK